MKWDYDKVSTVLKRYSFESKMAAATKYSAQLLTIEVRNVNYLLQKPLPFDIETFVMLSIKNGEWGNSDLEDKGFIQCINCIHEYVHPKLKSSESVSFAEWFLIMARATQFDIQADPLFRISRYYEYFTYCDENINMNTCMLNKFGISYYNLAAPILLMWMGYYKEYEFELTPEMFEWVTKEYPDIFRFFSITRDEYINELDQKSRDTHDYVYCLRPSYTWPFIEYEGIFFNPTPHLLLKAVTTSLVFRLTENDNALREKVGKYVFEPYVYKLVSRCGLFDEIIPEQEYGQNKKTLDVIASSGDDIICFDSKSFVPLISIRIFSEGAVNDAIERISKSVVQVYKHIHDKMGKEYTYLDLAIAPDRSNIFGIVVLQEDPLVKLEKIYIKAADKLGIALSSDDYYWLCGHIGIVDIDVLETQLYRRDNLAEALRHNMNTGNYSDVWFSYGDSGCQREYPDFVNQNCMAMFSKVSDIIGRYNTC